MTRRQAAVAENLWAVELRTEPHEVSGWRSRFWWTTPSTSSPPRLRWPGVLFSCNVLRNAQRLTAVDRVHAFVGGMHLTGGLFEAIIPATVAELAAIQPDVVVPVQCPGWRATHAIVAALPDAYVQSNVGTTLRFAAPAAPATDAVHGLA